MSVARKKFKDHPSISAKPKAGGTVSNDLPPLRPSGFVTDDEQLTLVNPDFVASGPATSTASKAEPVAAPIDQTPAEPERPATKRRERQDEQLEKDRTLLHSERWLVRNGHTLTFVWLYLFSVMVLFRPYELIPGLGFLSTSAFYFALATLMIFLPSQLATEGNLTMLSTDVKAILALAAIALFTIPIAKDPGTAWETFNEPFIKAVAVFVVMVNVVRTRKRLMAMMWLSLGVGIVLSYWALDLYLSGKAVVEGYRVEVGINGVFGNPNDMALHFVMMMPLAITLGIAAKGKLMKCVYFGAAVLFVGGNMVSYSRGGFLGLVAASAVLAWKIGRKYRLNVTLASIVIGAIAMVAAPGNYGLRVLSIFIPALDATGSRDQRWELLMRSLLVTARNPWGIGIGNFPIVGVRSHDTHNSFTQVSAELGLLGLAAYLIFIISPYRKLRAIERTLFDSDEHSWYYYLSIGLQASIVGYLVATFFASVAYNWFIYYLIAYAVAFRRTYMLEHGPATENAPATRLDPAPAV